MKRKLRPHGNRRVTDADIHVLKSHVTLAEKARAMGISLGYAKKIRRGRIKHKSRSP